MHKFISIFFTALLFISPIFNPVVAEEVSPYKVLEVAGSSLFNRISGSQQEVDKFPEYMRVIVEEELMPYVDYKYAAYRVLGKNLKKMSKEQRSKFVESMRYYLIRTYAKTLMQYDNQQVIFEPLKPTNGKRIVAINTQIVDVERPAINITFKMRQSKKTMEWKAFDMVVEGISLLDSKKAELSKRISKQGVEQVSLELALLSS